LIFFNILSLESPVKGAKGNSFEANLLQWCKMSFQDIPT